MRRTLEWLVLSLIGSASLAVALAQVPSRLRTFALLNAAYGALAGAGMGWLARSIGAPPDRLRLVLCALVIAGGQIAAANAYWRREAANAVRRFNDRAPAMRENAHKAATARKAIEAATPPHNPAARAVRDEQVRQLLAVENALANTQRDVDDLGQFRGYLRQRVRPLGDWPAPWPELFWLGEVLIGSAVGAWAFRAAAQREPIPTAESAETTP